MNENTTTGPVWGTSKTHRANGLEDSKPFMYHGMDRKAPTAKGVKVTRAASAMGANFWALADAKGKHVATGASATRYWAAPVATATKAPAKGTNAPASAKAAPAKGKASTEKAAPAKEAPANTAKAAAAKVAEAKELAYAKQTPDHTGKVHPGAVWYGLIAASEYSPRQTAERMGVAPMTLNRIFNGKGLPTAKVTVAFAKALGLEPADVWAGVCEYELALALATK